MYISRHWQIYARVIEERMLLDLYRVDTFDDLSSSKAVAGETEFSRCYLRCTLYGVLVQHLYSMIQECMEKPEEIWVLRAVSYENLSREIILFSAETKKIVDEEFFFLEFRKPKSLVR